MPNSGRSRVGVRGGRCTTWPPTSWVSIGSGRCLSDRRWPAPRTRYLAAFDPVTTPQAMVERMRAMSHGAILDDYVASLEELAATLDGVDADSWSQLAEAPPGHVTLQTLAFHALWDGWVHERDIALPLALVPVEDGEEVTACLLYAAILGPTISAAAGSSRSGTLVVKAEGPTIEFVVAVGDCVVARPRVPGDGDAPELARSGGGPGRGAQSAGPARPRAPPRGPLVGRRAGPGLLIAARRGAVSRLAARVSPMPSESALTIPVRSGRRSEPAVRRCPSPSRRCCMNRGATGEAVPRVRVASVPSRQITCPGTKACSEL